MLSVVIPAYNEELLLGRTLTAVNAAAREVGEAYEIIVADDASTDRTPEIAREHGARLVSVQHRQIAATRNSGAREANGQMLLFLDADTIATPEAVRGAVQAMRAGAVGGGCRFRFDGQIPLYGKLLQLAFHPIYRILRVGAGCFLFCTKDAFEKVGGFDERLFGAEELSLSWALGKLGRFVLLPGWVTTSGRKLRTHSAREILSLVVRIALAPNHITRREGMDLWYGLRRPDSEMPKAE